ncbi:MAG TPA: sel1 repeat family protein [Candidatus Melainabacteria bacterium]|jgi:TPR repeat protein|nr:sel1 repeat family protein [Candidatus Melainabacteria bacterium]HIN63616.1 sel1 repeat family protein [Candidatus Obscuribacterales bacterium]
MLFPITHIQKSVFSLAGLAILAAGTVTVSAFQALPVKAAKGKGQSSQSQVGAKAEKIDSFHEVHHHIVHQKFKLAAEKARILAVDGHPKAQTVLGMLYQAGLGVEKDMKTALYWLEKAAEQGLREAESYLGHLYLEGRVVEKDLDKAEHWLLKAAQHGEREAQVHLGLMYMDDKWAKKDIKHAEVWLREAALQDSEEAKIALEKIPGVKALEKRTKESQQAYSDGLYSIKDSWAGYGEIVKSVGAASAAASSGP